MATQLTTRIVPGTGATVKGDLLTNEEIDNNFLSINDNKLESENNLSDLTDPVVARTNLDVPRNDGTGATGDWSISALNLNDSGATFSYNSSESKWTAGSDVIIAGGFEGDVTGTVSDISNHTTDDLMQGSTNLYYSDSLARSAISVAGDLSYDSGTGVLSFTERTDQEVRNLFSASGNLSYDSNTGVFSISGISANDASITIDASSGLTGGGTFTTDQSFNETISVSHDNTSSESSTNNTGDVVVQNVSIDTYGHVTNLQSSTVTVSNLGTAGSTTNIRGTDIVFDDFNFIEFFGSSGKRGEFFTDTTGLLTFGLGRTGTYLNPVFRGDLGFSVTDGGNIQSSDNSSSAATLSLNKNDTDGQLIRFVRDGQVDGDEVGSVTTTGLSVSYNTSSDYRLKENVVDLDNATDRLSQIPVHRFNFTKDPEKTVDGFLAHEVQSYVPEAVTGKKDETESIGTVKDENGNVVDKDVPEPDNLSENYAWSKTGERPKYQGIDQAKLVPLVVAALQESIEKINELEQKIADLESSNT